MTTHADALDALDAALQDAVDAGQPIPCRTIDGPSPWIADKHETRAEAAEMCHGCPALDACAEVGQHERFGTWGGRDRTRQPGKKNPTTAKENAA